MLLVTLRYAIIVLSSSPFFYYLIALYSSWRFFSQRLERNPNYTPPVSVLKPVRGLDPNAYENFASFCKQDYPTYEILFCVDADDPAVPILEKIKDDFPQRSIRLLFGAGSKHIINDKVARLARLTNEASHDLFVITDGDVRVEPDYLRSVVGIFENPKFGAATCLYASEAKTFLQRVQSISMTSDFFAGIIVAWKLDGVKFTLAQTILTTRRNVSGFGGYPAIGDRPADDLYIGRLAAEQGLETKLLPYVVETVPDFESLNQLLRKRVRWMTVMRHMRPIGHFGLLFTFGLPWALAALAVHPTAATAVGYLGTYSFLRVFLTWLIGIRGMRQKGLWRNMGLIPLWDVLAFGIWLASFAQTTIRWRGIDYHLRNGKLTLMSSDAAGKA